MTTRRDFLLTVGGVNALLLLPGGAARERAPTEGVGPPPGTPLPDGQTGFEVISVGEVVDGAQQVQLRTAGGELFSVEVMRRDPEMPGVAHTETLELYLCNQGDGAHASKEEHCRGAISLARELEWSGADRPELLTLRERARRYPIYGRG